MTIKDPSKSIVTLLGTAMQTLKTHPVIFLPFCFLGFFQLLTLEILYFIPRPPLVSVLGPVVRRLWADAFLHYPLNLILLPKLQYYAQLFIYIIIGAFFAGVAVKLIAVINNEREIRFRDAVRETLAAYVHIFINTFVSFLLFFGMSAVYQLLVKRALLIRSETGILFWLKRTIVFGEPYFNLLIGIFVTAALAFVVPIIVIEKKKIFSALILNFKYLWRSFLFVFALVLLPTLVYLPILLLRSNIAFLMDITFPEMQVVSIVLSTVVTLLIDAVVLTAITILYLFKKELQ